MTFPVPVTLNRFLAPDLVFSLGIWLSCSGRNGRPTAHLAGDLLETSVLIEHFTAATAALYSRAGEAGVMPEAVGNRNREAAWLTSSARRPHHFHLQVDSSSFSTPS